MYVYGTFSQKHAFKPFAEETLGLWIRSAKHFLSDITPHLIASIDKQAGSYFAQRNGIAI